ncbi:MAG: response regulator transcription factor [Cyanobacteria bacterium P01_D01_bin.1]
MEIVVCAAQAVTRAGIAAMLKTVTTQIVAQLGGLQDLQVWLQTQRADLAVVELSTLEAADSETILQILEELPIAYTLSILLLIEKEAELSVQGGITQLIGTGSVNVVPTDASADQLRCAVSAVVSGLNVLHPDITEVLFAHSDRLSTLAEANPVVEPLTPREIQVLNQLASGFSNKAIAKALVISEHTVKFHISAILAKLNVSSRTEAVSVGIRAGLVML